MKNVEEVDFAIRGIMRFGMSNLEPVREAISTFTVPVLILTLMKRELTYYQAIDDASTVKLLKEIIYLLQYRIPYKNHFSYIHSVEQCIDYGHTVRCSCMAPAMYSVPISDKVKNGVLRKELGKRLAAFLMPHSEYSPRTVPVLQRITKSPLSED